MFFYRWAFVRNKSHLNFKQMCTAAFLVHLWDVFSSLEQRPCDLNQHAGSLARLLRSLTFRFTSSAEHFSETESQGESVRNTLMLPSDDPLMKQSSVGSTASALTGESWAWKLWRWCLWGRSSMLIQPFFPPVISSWCLGAMASTVAPESWQQKAEGGINKQSRGGRFKNRWTDMSRQQRS